MSRWIWRGETDRMWVVLTRPTHGWFYTREHCRERREVHGGICRQEQSRGRLQPNCERGRLRASEPYQAGEACDSGQVFLCWALTRRASVRDLLSCLPSRTLQDGQQVSHTKSTQTACICLSLVTQKARTAHFLSRDPVGNRPRSRKSNPA